MSFDNNFDRDNKFAKIDADCAEVESMWESAHSVEPDYTGYKRPNEIGELKKEYRYRAGYDEVIVETYENGASVLNTVTGHKEWFIGKEKVKYCFEKAKILKARYQKLSRMMY